MRTTTLILALAAALLLSCSGGSSGTCVNGQLNCACLDGHCHHASCSDNCANVCSSYLGQYLPGGDAGGFDSCASPPDAGTVIDAG